MYALRLAQFKPLVLLLSPLIGCVDALVFERSASFRSNRGGPSKQDKSVTVRNCTPPASFIQLIPTTNLSRPAVVMASSSYVLYSSDHGHKINLFAYDCTIDKQLIFLHIPKNAGSTIEDVALSGGIHWGYNYFTGTQRMPDGNDCSKFHVPPSMLEGPNPYAASNADVFCVTRDPWQRMLSEYTHLLQRNYSWAPYLNAGPVCTAEGFNAFLQRNLADIQAGRGRFKADCHFLPQWDYIEGPDGHRWCSHVMPLEGLTSEFNNLMVEHGIQFRLSPHVKGNPSSQYCPDLAKQADADLSSIFSEPSKKLMREVYAKDFAQLGDPLAGTLPVLHERGH